VPLVLSALLLEQIPSASREVGVVPREALRVHRVIEDPRIHPQARQLGLEEPPVREAERIVVRHANHPPVRVEHQDRLANVVGHDEVDPAGRRLPVALARPAARLGASTTGRSRRAASRAPRRCSADPRAGALTCQGERSLNLAHPKPVIELTMRRDQYTSPVALRRIVQDDSPWLRSDISSAKRGPPARQGDSSTRGRNSSISAASVWQVTSAWSLNTLTAHPPRKAG
jgi:hypothetical protein